MNGWSDAPIATVFGGSGFIGRYITRRLAREGWRVRVAVRRPNEALFVRTYGAVGQVEPVQANLRDEASCARAIAGASAVVNCVGILVQQGPQTFERLHVEGAGRVARLAAEAGAETLVHLSALGADATSESRYARTKAEGEAAVLRAFPEAMILRPSVVFGPEDRFFNRFASMARFTPVIPLVGAETRFQPVYVDDVAAAAVMGATGRAAGGVYELGGPDVATFRELIRLMLDVIRRRRLILGVPFPVARAVATVLDGLQFVSMGLFVNEVLTRDQVVQLRHDNVVSGALPGFADLGIAPRSAESVLDEYLYVYRPYGQYAALREAALRFRAR